MEEQRQRQEDEARRAQSSDAPSATKESDANREIPTEEAMLKRALAMSLEGNEEVGTGSETKAASAGNIPDFSNMTEEEQIAFAMQMSMQDQRKFKIDLIYVAGTQFFHTQKIQYMH